MRRSIVGPVWLCAVMAAGQAWAQATVVTLEQARQARCATRLSVALLGKSPEGAALVNADPQAGVDAMLASPEFVDRFARFVNASFNRQPGTAPEEDAPYYLAKEILSTLRPWRDLFVGGYRVDKDAAGAVAVVKDAQGLGYFRSPAWLRRYAGNEEAGYKLSTAYRILHNTIGLTLVPATNAPDVDISASGRQAAACKACHYDAYFALDKIAKILTRRVGTGTAMTFAPPKEGPQELLGGLMLNDDKELVTALVDSTNFKFRTCRLAFEYLYGRPESACEGPTFDLCMREFSAKGTLQSALASIAKDPSFCR